MRVVSLFIVCLLFLSPAHNLAQDKGEGQPLTKLGVICALPKELGLLADEFSGEVSEESSGMRQYLQGKLWGIDTVLATSRVGKVAAATTATHLIESNRVQAILYLGVAGAVDETLAQGDIVIGEGLVQYDLDSRPLTPQFTVPLINVSTFKADPELVALACASASDFVEEQGRVSDSESVDLRNRVHTGLIGTGDQFVATTARKRALKAALPELLAVDMEGAAVAQVCYEHGIPFVVIRTISDNCEGDAAVDCMQFLGEHAPKYTRGVLHSLYQRLTLQ